MRSDLLDVQWFHRDDVMPLARDLETAVWEIDGATGCIKGNVLNRM